MQSSLFKGIMKLCLKQCNFNPYSPFVSLHTLINGESKQSKDGMLCALIWVKHYKETVSLIQIFSLRQTARKGFISSHAWYQTGSWGHTFTSSYFIMSVCLHFLIYKSYAGGKSVYLCVCVHVLCQKMNMYVCMMYVCFITVQNVCFNHF